MNSSSQTHHNDTSLRVSSSSPLGQPPALYPSQRVTSSTRNSHYSSPPPPSNSSPLEGGNLQTNHYADPISSSYSAASSKKYRSSKSRSFTRYLQRVHHSFRQRFPRIYKLLIILLFCLFFFFYFSLAYFYELHPPLAWLRADSSRYKYFSKTRVELPPCYDSRQQCCMQYRKGSFLHPSLSAPFYWDLVSINLRNWWDISQKSKAQRYTYSNQEVLNRILKQVKEEVPSNTETKLHADSQTATSSEEGYAKEDGPVNHSTRGKNPLERRKIIQQMASQNHFPLPASSCFEHELHLIIRYIYKSALSGYDFHRKTAQIEHIYRVERNVEPNESNDKDLQVHYHLYTIDLPEWNMQNRMVQLIKGKPDITSNFEHALRTYHVTASKAFLKHQDSEALSLVMEPLTVPRINFVIPLRNRGQRFLNLLNNLKELQEFDKKLTGKHFRYPRVVVSNMGSEDIDVKWHLHQSGLEYTHIAFKPDAAWSKVVAMESALNVITDPSDLVFILDVDMKLPLDFMHRIRSHTLMGKRVYYPICYSTLKGKPVANDQNTVVADPWHMFHYGGESEHSTPNSNGFWRRAGTGMVGAYRYDFEKVSGYDTDKFSVKWGGEDGDLMTRFHQMGYEVVNQPELGYYHIFHEKNWSRGAG